MTRETARALKSPILSIKTKISVAVFLLVSTLMCLLTLAGYHYLAHALKESVSRQHATVLAISARHVDAEVSRCREMLALLAKSIDPETLNAATLQKRLREAESARAFFDGGFEIVDSDGVIVAETAPVNGTGSSVKNSDYFAMALASGKSFVSAPRLALRPPHAPLVTFSVPILSRDGTVSGLLAGRHYLTATSSLGEARNAVGDGSLILVDRNRTIMMHPDPERIMKRIEPGADPGLDEAIQKNRMAHGTRTDSGGELKVTAAVPTASADWIVYAQYPESEAYAPLHQARLFFAAGLAVILALTLLAVRALIGSITGPLDRLIGHVRALPSKEGEERLIELGTGDELDDLALSVNILVEVMDQKQEILTENRELYRMIADFTSELALLSDGCGAIRYISSNCLPLTGYADREFLEDHGLLDRIVHPADRQIWRERRRCCAGSGQQAMPVEVRLLSKGGETRWFSYTCHEVTGPAGEEVGQRGSFRDVTDAKRLEKMLEEQHQFLESLLENISNPLFVIDKEHRVIIWNRAIAELTGIPASAMVGTDLQWTAFYPEKRPTLGDVVLDGGAPRLPELYATYGCDAGQEGVLRAEGWYLNLNGRDRYLFFDAAPVKRDGEVVAVIETLHDITERARAEESLRLFSQAVEQSANAIVITDRSGEIQYVNRKFGEMTGHSPEEAAGKNINILKSGQQAPELYRELWETIDSGREWQGEFLNRRKNGTFFWEHALISPIADQSGAVTHFLGIKEDITSRKNAERELLKKQAELVLKHEQLSSLFRLVEQGKREWEQTMDCIDDIVAMVGSDHKIRRCNRAFQALTGYHYTDLITSDWRELLRNAGLDLDALGGGNGELFHEASQRWFTVKTYPYGSGGDQVIMLHDLTEIKKVSDQLVAAYRELTETHSQLLHQEKMASIGQLAAGVAHEINNPLAFISSNLGTMRKYLERLESFLALQSAGLEESAPEGLRDEVGEARRKLKIDYILGDSRSLLSESQDGAERVRAIVQNLKSFSRIDEAQASYVDLNECLESTISIAWNELKYKTTLVRDYGELPAVKCLPQQLNQVFLNMLVNAAHAIEQQGEVTISTRHRGDEVTVAISDTGCGIPEEIKSRIFEPFFTTKEVGKGTGLGLSISYDIIKKHNGTIEVESAPGNGTTFTIKLPVEGV